MKFDYRKDYNIYAMLWLVVLILVAFFYLTRKVQ